MRLAFYAPLKPPTHPVPSGDRHMALLLMAALSHAGHQVELAHRLRSRASHPARQVEIAELGRRAADGLIRRYRTRSVAERPEAWFTYHLYYKAPDWLGPPVADALDIPYLVAEASHAPKRACGPWAMGHEAVVAAIRRADAIFTLNPADRAGLELVTEQKRLVSLKPFLECAAFASAGRREAARDRLAGQWRLDPRQPWLLTVAMMRPGDKLASYRLLAESLGSVAASPWHLLVVGDGAARPAVEAAFSELGEDRIRFLGARPPEDLPDLYAAADLHVWPAVNEAYGMTLLEAQAAGLPVVAGRFGGVPAIVADGVTGLLTAPGDAGAFANAVRQLLDDSVRRRGLGAAAAERVAAEHDIASAASFLNETIRRVAARVEAES
ncbi:glycosyltransferase family 4 protein [Rhodospirillaceae bacterium SYSU D60014]|uniref:glycosyltransferase family 4 protein n=1 Tax=Virgifigura deserti TaxID=2268457 RepID=UPI000E669E90